MQRLSFLVALGLIGCHGGPAYFVTVRAAPLNTPCRVYLEPIHFERLQVGNKTEAEWQSAKKEKSQDSWQQDKAAFADNFGREIQEYAPFVSVQPIPGAYVLRPWFDFFEPGFYAYVASHNAETRMTMQLIDPAGHVVEEARADAVTGGGSVGSAMRAHGRTVGRKFGRYAVENLGACAR